MTKRYTKFVIRVGLIGSLLLAGAVGVEAPALADPNPVPEKAASVEVPGTAAPAKDLSPRSANVERGAKPARVAKSARVATTSTASAAGCGGGVAQLGKIYTCSSITEYREDVFTVTTTVDDDVLFGTLTETANNDVYDNVQASVYDADGNYLCYYGSYPSACTLGAAGTYTVVVALYSGQGDMAYTLSVQSQRTPSSCRTLGNAFFSFASAGRGAELPKGSAGDCYTFDQPAGSVFQMHRTEASQGSDVRGQILDVNNEPICGVQDVHVCAPSMPGPYRLWMHESNGNAATYVLRMSRLTDSRGCPVLRPTAFGDPGDDAGTGTLPAWESLACHKLRIPVAGGVTVRIFEDQSLWWSLYDDAGREICNKYESLRTCWVPAAGAHTLVTRHMGPEDRIDYRIAVAALYRPAGCTTGTSLNWNQPAAVLHQTSPVQTNCQQFRGKAGQRVTTYASPTRFNYVIPTLVDSTGRAFCAVDYTETGCLLPADGTYRVVSYLQQWDSESTDETYKAQVRSLTVPVGCPVVEPGAFNEPTAGAYGPIRCRIVRADTAGAYRIRAYDDENYRTYAAVFDATGHRICDDSGYCALPTAGDYTVVLNGQSTDKVIDNDFSYALSVLPEKATGCPPLSQELYRAAFTQPGEFRCVELPQSAGQRVVELVPAGTKYPDTQIYDATGEYICDSSYALWQTSCELTGTGPWVAVLSQEEGVVPGPVAARFMRVDGPPSCPAFDAADLSTGGDGFTVCRSIAADAHTAREAFNWKRTSGTGSAYLSVFDANGVRRCGPTGTFEERTVTCTLPAGPLMVVINAAEAEATYQLTRQAA
jgi:hypothetical protein